MLFFYLLFRLKLHKFFYVVAIDTIRLLLIGYVSFKLLGIRGHETGVPLSVIEHVN